MWVAGWAADSLSFKVGDALCYSPEPTCRRRPSPPMRYLQYDNLVMEESGQILEVETFIPMLLQVRHRSIKPFWAEELNASRAFVGRHSVCVCVCVRVCVSVSVSVCLRVYTHEVRVVGPPCGLNWAGPCPSVYSAAAHCWRTSTSEVPAIAGLAQHAP
jgi:hypothetical protein